MRLSVPAAILIGSVVIALGLYFGLRPAPTTAPSTKAPESVAAAEPGAEPSADPSADPKTEPSADPVATPTPEAPAPVPAQTAEQTSAAVEDLIVQVLPSWKAACWDSANPATRKPGRYVASLAFDTTGTLVIFGINEQREASDPSIAQCLRKQHQAFTIPAPGRSMTYEVPFEIP